MIIIVELSHKVRTVIIRFLSSAAVCASFVDYAAAQTSMGPIYDNNGIITQGQHGNNTIIQGPKKRVIDDEVAITIANQIRSAGSHKFRVWIMVGDDREAWAYNNRLITILQSGSWDGRFQGSYAMRVPPWQETGIFLCGKSPTVIPEAATILLTALVVNNQDVSKVYRPCNLYAQDIVPDDETVGIIIGSAR